MKRQDLEQQVNLLKRIVKDPNDAAVRLEYAEFLTKHGFDDEAFLHYNFCNEVELSKRWINELEVELGLPRDYLLKLPEECCTRDFHILLGDNEYGRFIIQKKHDEILKHWGIIYKRDLSDADVYTSCAC